MDFFKKAGNWFRGAFGESEEEKRRKKKEAQEAKRRQAQIQKPKPLVNPVVSPLFGDKKKPDQPDPTKPKLFQAQPAVTPPLTRPPELNKDQKQAQLKQLTAEFKAGRINQPQLEQRARKILGTEEKKNPGKVRKGLEVVQDVVNPIEQAKAATKAAKVVGAVTDRMFAGGVTRGQAEDERLRQKGRQQNAQDNLDKTLKAKQQIRQYANAGYIDKKKAADAEKRLDLAIDLLQVDSESAVLGQEDAERGKSTAFAGTQFAKEAFLEDPLRAVLAITQEAEGKLFGKDVEAIDPTMQGEFAEAVLGRDKIAGFGGEGKRAGFNKDKGLFDKKNAPIIGFGLTAAELIPGGGKAKKVFGELAKEVTEEGTEKLLREGVEGLAEREIKALSKQIPELSNRKQIEALVEEARLRSQSATPNKMPKDRSQPFDDKTPAYQKAPTTKEKVQQYVDAQKIDADFRADPANKPAFVVQAEKDKIVTQEMENLFNYLTGNPNLTRAQREVAQKAAEKRADDLVKALEESRAKTLGVVTDQGDEVAANAAKQAEVNAEVAAEQAAKTTPAPGQVVQDAPTPGKTPEVEANDAYTPDANVYSNVRKGNAGDAFDDLTTATGEDITRKDRGNLWSQFFGLLPRGQQAITRPISDLANKGMTAAQASKNPITSNISQFGRSIWARSGMTDKTRGALDAVTGMKNTAKDVGLRISRRRNETLKKLIDAGANKEELVKVFHQVFESPEFLARKYGDNVGKISPADLPPELKQIVDEQIELNKIRNWFNYQNGTIDEATYFAGVDGMHTPRVYGFDFTKKGQGGFKGSNFDETAGISRLDVNEVPDEIFDTVVDPITAQDIRFQQSLINKGRLDAIQDVKNNIKWFDKQPNSGFSQLKGKQFGELDGKWVDNQVATELKGSAVFKTEAGQKADELLDIWRNSPFGTADRFFKQTKTVGNIGTHVQNIGSNILAFARGAGMGAGTASARWAGGAKSLIGDFKGKFDADIYFLRKAGVLDGNTGRALNGVPEKDIIKVESMLADAELLAKTDPKGALAAFKKVWKAAQDIYGGSDDAMKIGAFREFKARGYSDENALRLVREQFQDYTNAGRGIAMAADSPVMGSPFARFIPELTRIGKNSLKNNPAGVVTGVGGLAYAGNKLSEAAGETPEQRAERENAVGQTKLPGTAGINKFFGGNKNSDNVSLNFAFPDKMGEVDLPGEGASVNIARATGLNFPTPPGGDANSALLEQLNPVSIPIRKDAGGHTRFAPEETVSSMTFNPLARLWADRDFMGRSISDPDNKIRYEAPGQQTRYEFENPDGTKQENPDANLNRARFLGMNYSPLASETDALQAGIRGKDDFYGKQRTPTQGILRAIGIKVEDNSPEAQEKRAGITKFYSEELPETQKWLDENPDLVQSYWKLKNTARDRNTDVSQNDLVSPERYAIIAADKSGRLFAELGRQAELSRAKRNIENEKEGKPLELADPLYSLPPDQANEVLKLKSMYTGNDTKFQETLYTKDWYKDYKKADALYQESKGEFKKYPGQAEQNDRPKEWGELSTQAFDPEEGIIKDYPLVQQYQKILDEKYPGKLYESDERKQFTKNWYNTHGNYEAQNMAYKLAKLDIINKMREIEGTNPMTPEVWLGKFEAFDPDDDGSGYGYGKGGRGGGGGGGSGGDINTLGKLTNFSDSVNRLDPIEIAAMPQLKELFARLQAGQGGGKAKPKLGASASGR